MKTQTLNRREFIETSGNFLATATGAALFASLIASCGKDNPVAPDKGSDSQGSENTHTLKLSDETSLQQVGGFKTYMLGSTPVITFRVSDTVFKTLSRVCTHQGCTVNWESSGNRFACPCHGSQYDKDGNVTKGPANASLATFKTEFDSNAGVVTVHF